MNLRAGTKALWELRSTGMLDMHALERTGRVIRHRRWLKHADGFWEGVRPMYSTLLSLTCRDGILRVINGDPMRFDSCPAIGRSPRFTSPTCDASYVVCLV
jgi:hypothetical protein